MKIKLLNILLIIAACAAAICLVSCITGESGVGRTDTAEGSTPGKGSSEPQVTVGTTVTTGDETEKTFTTSKKTEITTTQAVTTKYYSYDFKADLSAYEEYMNPSPENWSDSYLILLNAEHPVSEGIEDSPEYSALNSRVWINSTGRFTYYYNPLKESTKLYINDYAFGALSAMVLEAEANGINDLDITSAYRSFSRQKSIFNSNVNKTKKYVCADCGHIEITKSAYSKCILCKGNVTSVPITYEEAAAEVATYSCAPGTSDHQSGLAFDVVQTSLPSRYDSLIQEFGTTEAGIWLAENCYKFGFVLRFPEDKEDITGIIYEPWHFRYVGRQHASRMHELDMCLEEYLELLASEKN